MYLIVGITYASIILGTILIIVIPSKKMNRYTKDQKETGADKRAMLDLMSGFLEAEYALYSYAVGYFTTAVARDNVITRYYFPYILAFSTSQIIIFPFIKKEGRLFIRNQLSVDWNHTKFSYKISKNKMVLKFEIGGQKMPIVLNPVIKSDGIEKSERPLGIWQEEEFRRLGELLPQYRERARK